MRVEVSFRHLESSESLSEYATEKVGRLNRMLLKPIDAHVVLSKDGFRYVAEATVRDSGSHFTAKDESEDDMYSAIDRMSDKLARQARRWKSKMKDHRAASLGGTLGEMEALKSEQASEDLDAELDALGD